MRWNGRFWFCFVIYMIANQIQTDLNSTLIWIGGRCICAYKLYDFNMKTWLFLAPVGCIHFGKIISVAFSLKAIREVMKCLCCCGLGYLFDSRHHSVLDSHDGFSLLKLIPLFISKHCLCCPY